MILSGDAAALWDAARRLNSRADAEGLPPLLFFIDPARTPRPWETAARLPAGAAVVFRHFGADDARAIAERLREATRAAGVRLLLGLDADLAEAVGADGVHLPERALGQAEALRLRRQDWMLTGAVHSIEGVEAAPPALDALVLSPIFPAGGASASRPALGVEALNAAAAHRRVYALGGIGAATLDALADSGACGIAGVEAIQAAFAVRI